MCVACLKSIVSYNGCLHIRCVLCCTRCACLTFLSYLCDHVHEKVSSLRPLMSISMPVGAFSTYTLSLATHSLVLAVAQYLILDLSCIILSINTLIMGLVAHPGDLRFDARRILQSFMHILFPCVSIFALLPICIYLFLLYSCICFENYFARYSTSLAKRPTHRFRFVD